MPSYARMAMNVVIFVEESRAELPGMRDRLETFRKIRNVLQGLELGLGERVVVGDLRPGMRPCDPQIGQQRRHRFRGHRGAPVGVHRMRHEAIAFDGLGDEVLGQLRVLDRGDDPRRG